MIKINLLESVTDRPTGSVAAVESRVANPRMQTLLLAVTVAAMLIMAMGYDYISARSDQESARKELKRQQDINTQMLAVNNEQMELEKKTKDIQVRIDAIHKLRASQQGPGAVLREIKYRFDAVPGLYLRSVEQKEAEVTIKGESPNEAAVTRFGQSLEFSSGLFNNLNIETQREAAKTEGTASAEPGAVVPEVVAFTIKCNFTLQGDAAKDPARAANPAANQLAKK